MTFILQIGIYKGTFSSCFFDIWMVTKQKNDIDDLLDLTLILVNLFVQT